MTRLDNHAPGGVYARARAHHALYIYRPNNNNNNPYIPTPTHYTYWVLGGSASCARVIHHDTPKVKKLWCRTFCDFHNSFTQSRPLFTIPSQKVSSATMAATSPSVGNPPKPRRNHATWPPISRSAASHEPSERHAQLPWPLLPEAWHPPESNKGVSERLSVL